MAVAFKPEVIKEFEGIASRYPVRRAALLPALWLAQREFGFVSLDAMKAVAELVGCSPAQVLETASFYTMYHKQKPGKYHLQVCQTIACLLNGSEEIKKTIEQKLNLKPGQTTPDGQFSYQPVECLASCHTGPCMRVNEEYHENLTPEKTERMIDELRKK
jgi:NADH dehydrogenase (ubiquinone) flavoprotein 2